MTLRYPHIMARVFNRPLLLSQGKADIIARVMLDREQIAHLDIGGIKLLTDDMTKNELAEDVLPPPLGTSGDLIEREGYVVQDGVAIIPVCGTLVHKLGGVRPYSGMLGYDCIRANFGEALKDSAARGILLLVESPGGEVYGCFDLCDALYAARGTKPVMACVDELCCSGAMAIASTADVITVPRTGDVGSVGVCYMHTDLSGALDEAGIKITFIKDGDLKTDGACEQPLSPDAFDRIQKQVRTVGTIFKTMIARNRGIELQSVIDQQAAIYMGQDAVDVGLADAVMPLDQAFAEFRAELS